MAHVRQPRPDCGPGSTLKSSKRFKVFPSWLESGRGGPRRQVYPSGERSLRSIAVLPGSTTPHQVSSLHFMFEETNIATTFTHNGPRYQVYPFELTSLHAHLMWCHRSSAARSPRLELSQFAPGGSWHPLLTCLKMNHLKSSSHLRQILRGQAVSCS